VTIFGKNSSLGKTGLVNLQQQSEDTYLTQNPKDKQPNKNNGLSPKTMKQRYIFKEPQGVAILLQENKIGSL
tara:strand:- start:218 stop:433 length:216 start_codon:yes stop_codon:yes gene_type:complete